LLTTDEKIELLKQMTKHLKNVEIVSYSGLTTDFAIKRDVTHLIRGLRLTNPIHDEFQMALANRALSNLETVFILGDERYSHISSTIIRELIFSDADLTQFIPKQAKDLLMKKR
jgi:pantetheine-phosphate adenylyltransferase